MTTLIKTESDIRALIKKEDCIKVMTAVFEAMAYCETIRDIVEPKQQELINFFKFPVSEEFKERRGFEIVTKHSELYLTEESNWVLFEKEMVVFYKEQGLKHKDGCCPLLEAESLVRDVKRHAVNILEPYTGLGWDDLMRNFSSYKAYIDLMLTLFAPVVKKDFK